MPKTFAFDVAGLNVDRAWGNTYFTTVTYDIPSDLLSKAKSVQVTYNATNRGSAFVSIDNAVNGQLTIMFLRGTSASGLNGRLYITLFFE